MQPSMYASLNRKAVAVNPNAKPTKTATTVQSKAAFNSPKPKTKTASVTGSVTGASSSLAAGSVYGISSSHGVALSPRHASNPALSSSTTSSVGSYSGDSSSSSSSSTSTYSTPSRLARPGHTGATTSVYAEPDSPIASAVKRSGVAGSRIMGGGSSTTGPSAASSASISSDLATSSPAYNSTLVASVAPRTPMGGSKMGGTSSSSTASSFSSASSSTTGLRVPGRTVSSTAPGVTGSSVTAGVISRGVNSVSRTTGGVDSASSSSAGSNPAMFSPSFDSHGHSSAHGIQDIHGSSSATSSSSATAMTNGGGVNGVSSSAPASSAASSASISSDPEAGSAQGGLEHKSGALHSYSPPCMKCVHRAMATTNSNKQIMVRMQPSEHSMDDCVPDDEELDPFIFIKKLPALESVVTFPRKSPIPKKAAGAPPITLALDLDETLVHCSIHPIENPDLTFNVNFNGSDYNVSVRIRPHLEHFLRQVSQWFEVIIFTASQKVYADSLLNILDPKNEFIEHRVFRDSCVYVEGNFLKDLNILGRSLDKVCIIDNSFQAFGFQLDNGIPIESWFDDDQDCELLNLIPFLRHLKDASDVRPYIKNAFKLQEFVESLTPYYVN